MNARPSRFPAADLATYDIKRGESKRDPLDWYIEVCVVCGCQLGPGIGSRTGTGRCIYESHRSSGGDGRSCYREARRGAGSPRADIPPASQEHRTCMIKSGWRART